MGLRTKMRIKMKRGRVAGVLSVILLFLFIALASISLPSKLTVFTSADACRRSPRPQ